MQFQIPRSTDFWTGVMFAAFGAAALWVAQDYPLGNARRMGPGYFPSILGYGLCAIGLVLILPGLLPPPETIFRPFLVLVAVGLVALLLEPAGILIAAGVLILVSAYATHEFRLLETVVSALVLTAFCVVAFVYGLGLPISLLPRW